ncbi:hypothetical protein Pmani_010226 [Petrolisthes manimaculis]|uniref:Transposase n=1 Tax=Petrolisthes manimaculis TaxID=1843537 RepID=A0AAE1Q2K2_9EUCA|nr:hypothetical protein Pmani_010226 [Petrolisthes manimaculis]
MRRALPGGLFVRLVIRESDVRFTLIPLYLEGMATGRANSVEVISERGRIIGLWESGMPTREIALTTGVSQRSVQRWIKRFEEEGSLHTKPRSGRPRVTTPVDDARILNAVEDQPLTSAVHHTRNLHLPCHPCTTRRRIHEANIQCYIPATKENLTQQQRECRLGFALQYLQADHSFWNHVIFTDEKYFSSVEARARHCWRRGNTRYHEENIQERARSGRVGVNFWGWMWAEGPGELVSLSGRFTGKEYVKVLEDVLLPTVRCMAIPHPHPIIQVHDNSPVHTSNVVKKWLEQHPEIEAINWPPKGCDLNPIENLWAIMVRDWDVGEQRTCQAIETKAFDVWESIRRRPNICQNLVKCMPERINEVIYANGGWSSY